MAWRPCGPTLAYDSGTGDWIAEQMAGAGAIRTRRMFGHYGIYCDDRFVGVICGDRLFLKVTAAGHGLAPDLALEPGYDGAKPGPAIPDQGVEDADRLAALVRATRDGLGARR